MRSLRTDLSECQALASVGLVVVVLAAVSAVSALPSLKVEWTFNTSALGEEDFKWCIPMVVDLDGDGIQEVLVPATRFRIAALKSGQLLWIFPPLDAPGTYIYKVYAADDIDSDGRTEVVYGAGGTVYCLNHDGTPKWNWTDPNFGDGQTLIRDLDSDGKKDIIAVGANAGIYALDNDGRLKWSTTLAPNMPGKTGDPIHNAFDIDRDGQMEILILMRSDKSPGTEGFVNGKLYCLGPRGEIEWTWNSEIWSCFLHNTIAIGDVNGDGEYEIALGLWRLEASKEGGIVILNWYGSEIARKYFKNYCENEAIIWDIDGDAKKEVLVGSQEGYYYCLAPDLSQKWAFNLTKIIGVVKRPFNMGAAIGDVTGDGKIDVVFQSRDASTVCVLDSNGQLEVEPFSGISEAANTIAMGEVDGDGKSEIIACAGKIVYALTLDAPYNPATFVWPMQGKDPQHTGAVPIPEVSGLVLVAVIPLLRRR